MNRSVQAQPPPLRASLRSAAAGAGLIGLAGCEGERNQSALNPEGPAAEAIADLWWVMFWLCTGVFVLVLVLTAIALLRGRGDARPRPPLGSRFVILSGMALPSVVLVAMLLASIRTTHALREEGAAVTVHVIGYQWWWEVHYPEQGITSANEIVIPAGQPVRFEFNSADVIHSFWVPQLGGKMDTIPGMPTSLTLRARRPGEYRGQCAEYCGTQHALMALYVIALPQEEFDAWVLQRLSPPAPPSDERLARGHTVFVSAACANCHAIRGTDATGVIGPDLTHIGARRTLGAGTIPNNPGNLAGWISNPQPIKPGNLMPATRLSPEELLLLVDYLGSLQ